MLCLYRLQWKCLREWWLYTENAIQARNIELSRLLLVTRCLVTRCLAGWRNVVAESHQHCHFLEATAIEKWRDSLLRQVFHAWFCRTEKNVLSCAVQRDITERFFSFVDRVLQKLVLRGWAQVTQHSLELQVRRRKFERFLDRVCLARGRRLLRSVLQSWSAGIHQEKRLYTNCIKLFARVHTRLVRDVFSAWHLHKRLVKFAEMSYDCLTNRCHFLLEKRNRLVKFVASKLSFFLDWRTADSFFLDWRRAVLESRIEEHAVRVRKREESFLRESECRESVTKRRCVTLGQQFLVDKTLSRVAVLAERAFWAWQRITATRALRRRVDWVDEVYTRFFKSKFFKKPTIFNKNVSVFLKTAEFR